jgi:translation initiation factor eIF-2B subunit beta
MICENKEVLQFIMKRGLQSFGSLSSYELAVGSCDLVKVLAEESDWSTAKELIDKIRSALRRLEEELPTLNVVHNTIRRILRLVRDEYLSASSLESGEEKSHQDSLHRLIINRENSDYGKNVTDLRERVEEIIEELRMEYEGASEEISKQALQHIHANEIIMTIGRSKTVEKFLKFAAKQRKFQVIVAENAPSYSGHQLAANLGASKISTTVIPDSAIFALMARVNKVIIGTSAILKDGGLNAISGSQTVALAAKHYSVPLIVLGATYKLTPKFIPFSDKLSCSIFASPGEVLGALEGASKGKVSCVNPILEQVAPGLVTLFISNISGYSPSYVYRQIAELYHAADEKLESN